MQRMQRLFGAIRQAVNFTGMLPLGARCAAFRIFNYLTFRKMIQNPENDGLAIGYARLQARYWADPSFAPQLSQYGNDALKEFGLDYGQQEVEVVVNTPSVSYIILPARPAGLSNSQVSELAAAGTFGTAGSVASAGTICGTAATFGTLGTFGCSDL